MNCDDDDAEKRIEFCVARAYCLKSTWSVCVYCILVYILYSNMFIKSQSCLVVIVMFGRRRLDTVGILVVSVCMNWFFVTKLHGYAEGKEEAEMTGGINRTITNFLG